MVRTHLLRRAEKGRLWSLAECGKGLKKLFAGWESELARGTRQNCRLCWDPQCQESGICNGAILLVSNVLQQHFPFFPSVCVHLDWLPERRKEDAVPLSHLWEPSLLLAEANWLRMDAGKQGLRKERCWAAPCSPNHEKGSCDGF